jgi:UDP-glucose 4-epimerase
MTEYMAKIFITGGAGFIGSHSVDVCVKAGHEVTVYDIRPWSDAVNLHSQKDRITYVEGDILEKGELQEAMKGHTHVLHLAALVSVPESIQDPIRFHDTNVTGTLHVFEVARELDVQRLVYASSAAVYGAQNEVPVTENAQLLPLSPYGLHKVMNELYAELYNSTHGQNFLGLRYFNVYGPRQDSHSPYSGVISIFAERIKNGEPVTVYGSGEATRDFVSVYDVARSNLLALESDARGVCNIGTGVPSSINKVIGVLETLMNTKAKKYHKPNRKGDIQRNYAAVTHAQHLIDFSADDTLEDGLNKMLSI